MAGGEGLHRDDRKQERETDRRRVRVREQTLKESPPPRMMLSSTVEHNHKKNAQDLKGLMIMLLLSSDPTRSQAAAAAAAARHSAVRLPTLQSALANTEAPGGFHMADLK